MISTAERHLQRLFRAMHGVLLAQPLIVIYSLMFTCRACDVEPYAYLRHVLTELPRRADDDNVSDLLPFNYALALAARPPASSRDKVRGK